MFGLLGSTVVLICGLVSVSEARTYDGEFVVRIVGGPQTARMISEEMGFHYKGPVSKFRVQSVSLVETWKPSDLLKI